MFDGLQRPRNSHGVSLYRGDPPRAVAANIPQTLVKIISRARLARSTVVISTHYYVRNVVSSILVNIILLWIYQLTHQHRRNHGA
jgi:hypothetical protein